MASISLYTLIFFVQIFVFGNLFSSQAAASSTFPLPRRIGYPAENPKFYCFKACVNFHIRQKSSAVTIADECCELNPDYKPEVNHESGTRSQSHTTDQSQSK